MSGNFVPAEIDDGIEEIDTTEQEWLPAEQADWITIACDLDDVVVNSYGAIIAYYNARYKKNFCKEDFTSYLAWEVWGVSRESAISVIRDFYRTKEFKNLGPVEGAVNALRQLARNYHLHAITGRPSSVENETAFLVDRHALPFHRIHHMNFFIDGSPRSKADVCAEIGASVIIEDYLGHAVECADRGMRVILFDQPWNRRADNHPNIERVHSWDEVLALLL